VKPANLTEHLLRHREGDIFWWLQHGIPGTPMPAFSERMNADRLWDVVNFLHAQADAEAAKALDDTVQRSRPIIAPDFTFQIDHNKQESLEEQRGRVVLLVFYRVPESLSRLRALSSVKSAFDRAAVRVIALPIADGATALQNMNGVDRSMIAEPDPSVIAAYSLFRQRPFVESKRSMTQHIEILIDGEGDLRGRWTLSSRGGWDSIGTLLQQVEILKSDKTRSALPVHVH
jgi:peroxiredoxin